MTERDVQVHTGNVTLEGTLTVPDGARGVVLFAHGSGSSRHSPRNRFVAEQLRQGGLATLLLDLLTPEEEALDDYTRHLRFDIGLFGASTGAAAALVAAAARPDAVEAVVSRGGRPDLAGPALPLVRAPSLFIVGGRDETVIELNQRAMALMRAPVKLDIVPGATHLFEEPGALEQVARLARDWFVRYLVQARAGAT